MPSARAVAVPVEPLFGVSPLSGFHRYRVNQRIER
jgi:hypothetical protein